ncbi:MAG: ATP-binding protein [Terriglobia bacterium]
MTSAEISSWEIANQRYLVAALAVQGEHLERHAARVRGAPPSDSGLGAAQEALRQAAEAMPAPPALETLSTSLGLSNFEKSLLLLCAGRDLDSRFGAVCAGAHGDLRKTYPTFSLALAALPEAHWTALLPARPLRYWRLIELAPGEPLTQSPLHIDERILHYLAGVNCLDERLRPYAEAYQDQIELPPSLRATAEKIAEATFGGGHNSPADPAILLCGEESQVVKTVAAAACALLGMNLYVMPASTIPQTPGELDVWIRLWEREAALAPRVLLVDCDGLETGDAARESALIRLVNGTRCPLFLSSRHGQNNFARPVMTLDIAKPTRTEQKRLWEQGLGNAVASLNGHLEAVLSEFNFSPLAIRAASSQVLRRNGEAPGREASETSAGQTVEIPTSPFSLELWDACRNQVRTRIGELAQRIEAAARWDDLVLPATQRQTLIDIAGQVRQRFQVYESWGFASKSPRGLGVSALFAGPSGTGKTLAAEVLAQELRLDLYRIDLSQVVSKYIGETEKNLRRVFDAAEAGGVILFFDEADALFGKRSEVKDSHDRYANIEISYLLQRMEAFRGLAILATNLKNVLDPAFLRRIRFVVHFPFPDAAERAEIWRRIFPASTPIENLDLAKLAKLNVSGGNIRSIALNAAFLAADEHQPVRMAHLLRAARQECAKLERPLSESEIGGWA